MIPEIYHLRFSFAYVINYQKRGMTRQFWTQKTWPIREGKSDQETQHCVISTHPRTGPFLYYAQAGKRTSGCRPLPAERVYGDAFRLPERRRRVQERESL
jgi:hypothetical protein